MDPFSIALGVLQITGVTIKVSSLLKKRIRAVRNYSREVDRVLKSANRQRKNFLHEIHLLLRLAKQDEHAIERMLEDAEDPQWSSRELQSGLESAFPRSLDTIQDVVEDIKSTLCSLQGELTCFDDIEAMAAKNEPVKDTIRRVRKKMKVAWNKENLDEHLKSLRQLNDDLRRIREQAAEIKQPVLRSAACAGQVQQLSKEYGSIGKVRRASKAFHQALSAAWLNEISKTQSDEVRHNVKVKIDAEVGDEVKMGVVIACHGHSCSQLASSQAGLFNLQVESRILDFIEIGLNTPPHSIDDGGHQKKRRVRFNFDHNLAGSTSASSTAIQPSSEMVDLGIYQSICTVLRATTAESCESKCLGYLDSCCNETFRHSFFHMKTAIPISQSLCVSAEEIIGLPVETSVTLVDQLTLARSFAMAVLKFHSTPWLSEYVSIRELSFFRFNDGDVSSCIRTAHLGSDFVQTPVCEVFPTPTEDMGDSGSIEEAKLVHGVRNLTLWGLGTIMLQIGTWSTIEATDDVVAVRRLAHQVPMLGRRYRDLTKQCLDCDFAFGDDLSKPRLQQAVYEHVVCGLTELIKALDVWED